MKILGVSYGTVNGGNDTMVKEALMGAQEVGAEIEFINVNKLNIKHCTGCKACVMGLFAGKGNACVLKDDFQWLVDKMYEADGLVISVPIFEKGATGLFHTTMDRFGPRMDRGNLMIAQKIAEEHGGKPIDPKYLSEKVVSYMAVGGSDWATRVQADCAIQALTPKWTMVHNDYFQWSLGIMLNDEYLAKAHQIGVDTANAAKPVAEGTFEAPVGIFGKDYKSDPGICPHCHSKNFYLQEDGKAICCTCGLEGKITVEDGKYVFTYPEDTLPHAHDTITGKFIHGDDIQNNERDSRAKLASEEMKARKKKYMEFIQSSRPEQA
jgi:multimeric flavodoxin WrbA